MRKLFIAGFVFVVATSQAFGWSASGHKIVGSVAFRQLTPAQQAAIVSILKHHPRFNEDFESQMPSDLKTPEEQNEWLFQQAAIWPDIARGFDDDAKKKYHRPWWHFINIPYFLTNEDRVALQDKLTFNMSLDPPATESENMNAIQAIRFARAALASKDTSDEKKAVMLCWLMHDVGDIHQPLHSTALVSQHLFPNGDKGGNMIQTDQRQNLHALWDGLLGDDSSFRACRNRAISFVNDSDGAKLGNMAAKSLDEKRWLEESCQLAADVAYGPEVCGNLRSVINQTRAPPIRLSETYLKTAGVVAAQRVDQAGYRLGAILKQLFPGK